MANRKKENPASHKSTEKKRIQAVYAKSRARFSAADLQKFNEIEEWIPAKQVLAELEQTPHQLAQSKRQS